MNLRMPKWMRPVLIATTMLSLAPAIDRCWAAGTLRIAMTATDVPTTTGAPDNGYEGLRFLGYPVSRG
jgi:peptide/nickel transport system substrate-binding protein